MSEPDKTDRKTSRLNMTLAVVAGQVGCLTLVIVLAATLAGLWLDSRYQTKPTFTLVLVIASIPISVLTMLAIVRSAVKHMKVDGRPPKTDQQKEGTDFGGDKGP